MDDLCKRCKINKTEVKYSKAGEKYCKLCDYYIHNIMNNKENNNKTKTKFKTKNNMLAMFHSMG